MTYDHRTGRGLMEYRDVRREAERGLKLLRAVYDETGQRPIPAQLVELETILSRIAGATPA